MRATAFIRTTVKDSKKATVYFRVRDVDQDIKASSELTINPAYWDSKRLGYKARVSLVKDEVRQDFDRQIQEILAIINKEYYRGADNQWLKKLLFVYHHPNAFRLEGKEAVDLKLTTWIKKYYEARQLDKRQVCIYTHIIDMIQHFELYQQKVKKRTGYVMNIDTLTADEIREFEEFVSNEVDYYERYPLIFKDAHGQRPKVKRQGNYMNTLMHRLRIAAEWVFRQGATNNHPFDKYEVPTKVYGTPYYLTLEERDIIFDLDLSDNTTLAAYRDTFLFQCLIGCRHSDLIRLTEENIVNGAVEYIPSKTKEKVGRTVRVPLNNKAKAILERLLAYKKSQTRKRNTLVPRNALGEYNKAIRKILTLAGITRIVTVLDPRTHEELRKPINEIASSHMARRVFVGNLYKQVKDPALVASMSGHTNGSIAFARYRTIDDDMKRELVNMID